MFFADIAAFIEQAEKDTNGDIELRASLEFYGLKLIVINKKLKDENGHFKARSACYTKEQVLNTPPGQLYSQLLKDVKDNLKGGVICADA